MTSCATKNWGYEHDELDPSQWCDEFGAGQRQSPIDIVFDVSPTGLTNGDNQRLTSHINISDKCFNSRTGDTKTINIKTKTTIDKTESSQSNVQYAMSKQKIFLGYPRCLKELRIVNTGHSWQVNIPREIGEHTLMWGPPFSGRQYQLAQFHCHWGADDERGSEHTINGRAYAAELHFVHWNCSQYKSLEEAAQHRHGLAVLAVFIQAAEGEQNGNKYLEKIIANFDEICAEPEASAVVSEHIDIKKLFPANRWAYASYEGSLTTPPLSECVDWVVFLNPITCSTSQIDIFRQLQCGGSKKRPVLHNCRPVQPLNNRIVNIWSNH